LVQKEFAEKMGASPGDRNYGRLSVTAQIAFEICIERTVLRHLFRPVPKVDSAIIILAPTGKSISQFEENIIRYIFQHKKKTVRNALLDSKMFGKEEIDRIGPFARRRGVTLSKDECLEIARLLGKA
jgi:16S rRNA (adenine1518-N6/adenine1519-N6)-dimethyltransferase